MQLPFGGVPSILSALFALVIRVGGAAVTAKFVMLALATVSLAACATATTDDLSVRRGASPTRGDLGLHAVNHHRVVVRGPVVPDTVVAARPARATARHSLVARSAVTKPAATRVAATRPAVTKPVAGSKHAAHEVPNPLRQAPAAPATVAQTAPASGLPTEPVQPASATEPPADAAATSPQSVIVGDVPVQEPSADASAPSGTNPPTLLGLSNITPATIEQMFGGMPFWLISVIAAALVATFGLALRSKPEKREAYEEPRVDPEEDYREPYAA